VDRLIRIGINVVGAASAVFFARASVLFYLHTHRLTGVLFILEQAWFIVAFLIRRPGRDVSHSPASWLTALGGTFGGLLLRPEGSHPPGAVAAGFWLQLGGVLLALVALSFLGRSFGLVAADRGVRTGGPYRLIRHPVYVSYVLIQSGYVLQAISLRNLLVLALTTACNIGRIAAEERVLSRDSDYQEYRQRVRWRAIPHLW
jgi:protein-S-isoprenylcysteine O-methyltransferase Ste14